ncbi:MAG: DUF359 domain-containing protein [Candidatus Bathyarchaeota archaeon]|nr:MAG: DUF359 domain-containing protein [Candidatus Bathyarchaeota archaeon]
MAVAYSVTPELRARLKEPFGMLIRGSFTKTMGKMDNIVKREKSPMIISVGDTVSRNLHDHQMNPQLSITDNKRMRMRIKPRMFTAKLFRVKNPQGTITEEAIAAIKEALEGDERVHIIVDGEEDLLTLIAVLYAPEKSLVVYGQPYEGIVVVKVTSEKKAEATEILEAMKTVRKAK